MNIALLNSQNCETEWIPKSSTIHNTSNRYKTADFVAQREIRFLEDAMENFMWNWMQNGLEIN
jgi:hypothetical protein